MLACIPYMDLMGIGDYFIIQVAGESSFPTAQIIVQGEPPNLVNPGLKSTFANNELHVGCFSPVIFPFNQSIGISYPHFVGT